MLLSWRIRKMIKTFADCLPMVRRVFPCARGAVCILLTIMTTTVSPAAMPTGLEPVPALQERPKTISAKHPKNFSSPWKMQQAWLAKEVRGFQAGTVSMAWQPDALYVLALLPDREIFSRSSADGQELWTLGDVFEIFVRRENSPTYLELHVSPNGHQLHLRWTEAGMQRIKDKKAVLKDFMADSREFESRVFPLGRRKGWAVFARIPARILPDGAAFAAGEVLSISFSRYDTDGRGENAVLSSTSPHEKLSYHRLHEWRKIVLE
jgi:hypothetical protein